MYAHRIKDLASARLVFDEVPQKRSVYCWTSLIAGYAYSGQSEQILQLILMMVNENLRLEDDTMVNVLSACLNLEMVAVKKWIEILSDFVDTKNFGYDSVDTVLLYLYEKWGKVEKSREKFDEIGDNGKQSVLAWNAMIDA